MSSTITRTTTTRTLNLTSESQTEAEKLHERIQKLQAEMQGAMDEYNPSEQTLAILESRIEADERKAHESRQQQAKVRARIGTVDAMHTQVSKSLTDLAAVLGDVDATAKTVWDTSEQV